LQRVDKESAWKLATGLASHGEDADDHNLPNMIWFGFEPLVAADPARALAMAATAHIPLLAEYTARRTVDADATDALIAALNKKPATRANMLKGMRDALEGRNDLAAPSAWAPLYATLQNAEGNIPELAREIAQLFGDSDAARHAVGILNDQRSSLDDRRRALQRLAFQQRPELLSELPSLLENAALRLDAIRATAAYDDEKLAETLIKKYPGLDEAAKREVLLTLSARPRYGRMLTSAIKDGSIRKSDVPLFVARQLRRVVGSGFVETWGPIDELPAKDNAAYNKYQAILTSGALAKAKPANGKVIFMRTCGSCHTLFGEGGTIGPDLTGSNRANTNYVLSNVLNPSDEIQDDYKMVVVTTRDGRTYSGNVIGENERQITLRVVGQNAVVVNKSDIQSREATEVSMMPPGLLDRLSDEEVLDLMAYLHSPGPVTTGL
jgi:putative heme-binding domain-containing protein